MSTTPSSVWSCTNKRRHSCGGKLYRESQKPNAQTTHPLSIVPFCCSGALALGKNPVKCFAEVPKNANSVFSYDFTKDFEHPSESIDKITRGDNGSAGFPGKYCCLRDPADVIGFQCELSDLSEIHDLREAGVEIRILPKLFLVRECVGQGDSTRSRGDHQPALLVYRVGGGHLAPPVLQRGSGETTGYSISE